MKKYFSTSSIGVGLALLLFSFLGASQIAQAQLKVNGRHLYDECGNKIVFRGANVMTLYWDGYGGNGGDWSQAGKKTFTELAKTGANSARIFWHYKHGTEGWRIPATALDNTLKNCTDQGMIAIPGLWEATGDGSQADFNSIVDYWTSADIVDVLKKYEDKLVINIANEWNAGTNDNIRSSYANAISRIRATGLKAPIMVDGGRRWSQDESAIFDNAAYIQNQDPNKNIVFSMHMYDPINWVEIPDLSAPVSRLKNIMDWVVNNNVPFVWGEFAQEGHNNRAVAWEYIMEYSQQKELGWFGWVWWCCGGLGDTKTMAGNKNYGTWINAPWGDGVTVSSPYSIQKTSVKYNCQGGGNTTPSGITWANPTNGATISGSGTVNIPVQVNTTGNISKVSFWYDDWQWLGSDNSAPFGLTWSNVSAGAHTLRARAVDGNGNTLPDRVISFTVTASTSNGPPTVSWSYPTNGNTINVYTTLKFNASASVTKVAVWYDDWKWVGNDTGAPFEVKWNNAPVGTHTLRVRGTTSDGTNTKDVLITVTVNGAARTAATPNQSVKKGIEIPSTPESEALLVYPNPSVDGNIRVDFAGKGDLSVIGLKGETILKKRVENSQDKVLNLPQGFYTVVVRTSGRTFQQKVLVQ